MKPTLLVLAAGMGSRYGGLKQMDPMGPSGETILDYSVFDAVRAGFGKVVFIICPDFEQAFKEMVAKKNLPVPVDYAFQSLDKLPAGFSVPAGREKPWGTTHAILCAKGVVKENFAIINADDFYGRNSYEVLANYLKDLDPNSSNFSMVGFLMKNTLSEHGTVARGVCETDASNHLVKIAELTKIAKVGDNGRNANEDGTTTDIPGDTPVSMNMWGCTPKLFDHLDRIFLEFLKEKGTELKSECFIPMTIGQLINEGNANVTVLRTDSAWFGVTYKEDKPVVQANIQALIAKGEYPDNLWKV